MIGDTHTIEAGLALRRIKINVFRIVRPAWKANMDCSQLRVFPRDEIKDYQVLRSSPQGGDHASIRRPAWSIEPFRARQRRDLARFQVRHVDGEHARWSGLEE